MNAMRAIDKMVDYSKFVCIFIKAYIKTSLSELFGFGQCKKEAANTASFFIKK